MNLPVEFGIGLFPRIGNKDFVGHHRTDGQNASDDQMFLDLGRKQASHLRLGQN